MTEEQQTGSLIMQTLKKCLVISIIYLIILLASLMLAQVVNAPINIKEAQAKERVDFVAPQLRAICSCESAGNWNAEPIHMKNGSVLRGKVTPEDVGICQINEKYHLENAKRMGFNIYSLEGNVGYANYLYETQGTKPWAASKKCWDK